MTTSQRLAGILICLGVAFRGPAAAILSWAAEHPTASSLIVALILAAPMFRRRRPQYARRTAKAPPHAHYSHAA